MISLSNPERLLDPQGCIEALLQRGDKDRARAVLATIDREREEVKFIAVAVLIERSSPIPT